MESVRATPAPQQDMPNVVPLAVISAVHPSTNRHPDWVSRKSGRWRWWIHADWVSRIEQLGEINWEQLDTNPRARQVKINDGRTVWCLPCGGETLFVKVSRPGKRWARLRRLLLGSDARGEWRTAEYAAGHGIAAVRPIAVAEAPINGRQPTSIFVTLGIDDARPLNECWLQARSAGAESRRECDRLIAAVAELLARAHQGGFEHFDLHAGNVLIQRQGAGYRALFVDLHNIRTGRPVDDDGVVRNLAQLNQWFRAQAPLTDRIRFLNGYLKARRQAEADSAFGRPLGCDRQELLFRLEPVVLRHANSLYTKRDHRIMRTGRYFARIHPGRGWHAHVYLGSKHQTAGSQASAMTFTAAQWMHWLQEPVRWVTPDDRRLIIKDSQSGMVCRGRLEGADGGLEVVCKRALPRTFARRILFALRMSRPMRTWRRGNALLHRQIPTARPLAVVEHRRCGLLTDSFIVTEYLAEARDLDTLITVHLRELSDDRQRAIKHQLADALAAVVRRMHERGFVHRDFKAPNVMVQWSPASDDPPRVLLVDLDGLKPVRHASPRHQLRALVRLNVSLDHCKRVTLTDRLRFLIRYLQRPGQPDPQWKETWRQIARQCERKRGVRRRHQEKMLAKYGRF